MGDDRSVIYCVSYATVGHSIRGVRDLSMAVDSQNQKTFLIFPEKVDAAKREWQHESRLIPW